MFLNLSERTTVHLIYLDPSICLPSIVAVLNLSFAVPPKVAKTSLVSSPMYTLGEPRDGFWTGIANMADQM